MNSVDVVRKCFSVENIEEITDVSSTEKNIQFASNLKFHSVKLKNSTTPVDVVVKFQVGSERHRKACGLDSQFHNENIFYDEILPFLKRYSNKITDLFPKYYGGYASQGLDADQDFLILDNVSKNGFKASSYKVFNDFDHCSLAISGLAILHAVSYKAKYNDPDTFNVLISKLQEVRWKSEMKEEFSFIGPCMEKGIGDIKNEKFINQVKNCCDDPLKFMEKLVQPTEPLATLCHGDYCMNNLLFRYDSFGKPNDIQILDLQLCRYSSPVIDISFFLYLNTDKNFRDKHYANLLNIYYKTLIENFPESMKFNMLKRELTDRSIYGYAIISFFLPVMLTGKFDFDEYVAADTKGKIKIYFKMMTNDVIRLLNDVATHITQYYEQN